jgi:DNA helicase II / ATP-dependent DNA helicase PcrA
MDYQNLLNENQFKAVSTDKQYVRVVAGAGSGKTRVLTYRLSYLIGERGVDPYSIVAIAFTNKVAGEMKTRAQSLLGPNGKGLSVSTFHSFCARFLRREIDAIGYPVNFTIMDQEDSESLIKNIGVELNFKRNDDIVKYAINYIAMYKCKGIYPNDITLRKEASDKEKTVLRIFHMYEDRKDQMYSLDFDDLLMRTIQILKENQEIRYAWQERIEHILVDEFQDTNDVQYELLKLLMNDRTSLYVVGDPDQTIYTWRGANQNIIMNFEKEFPNAETIILDRNYRSTKVILDTANKLIEHNKLRVPKYLYTDNNEGDPVNVTACYSRELEAKTVVNQIERLHLSGVEYREIAVLYRAAYLTLPFENELMRRRIPYRIYGGLKFFQRKEIKDVLAYFRLIYNEKDDLSFERVVNVPRRGIGDSSIDCLKAEKEDAHLSYLEYLDQIENHDTALKPRIVSALTMLIGNIKSARAGLKEGLEAYPKLLEDFIRKIGYFDYLQEDEDTAEDRLSNVKALFENITSFFKDFPESTFDEYLQNAALQTSQDEIQDLDQLSLMTIHVAKGLEFNYVFVVSVIDGVFPSMRTMDDDGAKGLEEERRLCYVAFTRAKKKLYVSYNNSYSFVLESRSIQSRFVEEAGLNVSRQPYSASNTMQKNKTKSFGYYADDRPNSDFKDIFEEEKPQDNGITDWHVGDKAIHEVFGRGVVTNIIDDVILEVDFEQCGKKSIMANHPKIRREEKGAQA